MKDKFLCSLKLFIVLLVLLFTWRKQDSPFALQQGCGSVVNNSLRSPGYPNNYPSDLHCVYSIPIAKGMALNISFEEFILEEEEYGYCNYDYLKITDGGSHTFDVYCGKKTGESIAVTGDQVVLTFHSDDIVQLKGFVIFFTTVPLVNPKVTLRYPVARTLPGFKLSLCSTKGTPPVYTALTRNSTVIINTTNTDVTIRLYEEGNYTCVATGKYAADMKEFSVIFNDCGPRCSFGWKTVEGNILSCCCTNLTSPVDVVHCAPKVTEWL